jgi:hypothetical protein
MNKLKFLFLSLLLFLGACSQSSPAGSSNMMASETSAQKSVSDTGRNGEGALAMNSANAAAPQSGSLDQAEKSKEPPVERKIIRNAELALEAASPEEAQQKITALAESKGGFVVESQQSSTTAQATVRDKVTMTLRVPADKFNETLDEVRKTASRVVVETVKGQDVTEEFIDIEARLKTKKALEAQFLEIMKQAKTVEDTLTVQTELSKIRGEVEQIEGRKRFLESQTSLSTIKLTLQTPTAFSANSSGFFYQLGKSFSSGFEVALNFILIFITFIIAILPFMVLVVLPIYLVIRYFWKRYKKHILADKLAYEENKENPDK